MLEIKTNDAESAARIIVVGVGGAGNNAVNRMVEENITGVEFIGINTDKQALQLCKAPKLLQIGEKLTKGLGAGAKPEIGEKAAEESSEEISAALKGADMVFVTCGMGGGTGTGAAPVIARISKELGILTVGIVTIPFRFEGIRKIDQALDGVEEMSKHVDALLVINNERLRSIYPELTVLDAFGKADDTLSVAAKSIAEIITNHGLINLDFNDVKTVLKDGGVAIMSTGYGEGDGRVKQAIQDALNSPLLNDRDIFNAKKILLNISFSNTENGNNGLMMEEMNDVNDFMAKFDNDFEIKWGIAIDPELSKKVKVTILATGFGIKDVEGMNDHIDKRHNIEDAQKRQNEAEKEAQRADIRGHYYGTDGTKTKRRHNIFIFDSESLDNDNVIIKVEDTPTYIRSKKCLDDIRNEAKGNTTQETKPETNNSDNTPGIISFV